MIIFSVVNIHQWIKVRHFLFNTYLTFSFTECVSCLVAVSVNFLQVTSSAFDSTGFSTILPRPLMVDYPMGALLVRTLKVVRTNQLGPRISYF